MNVVSFVALGEGKVLGEIYLVLRGLHMAHSVSQEADGIALTNGNGEKIVIHFDETKIYKCYSISVQQVDGFIRLAVLKI